MQICSYNTHKPYKINNTNTEQIYKLELTSTLLSGTVFNDLQ